MPDTSYVETEVLRAVMEDDEPRARRLLVDMYPNELRDLHRQLTHATGLVARRLVALGES